MTPERFALLTRRHRECLRGVKALKGSKEIAAELGLGKSTVDSYLAEAVRLLGARNRREAALALAEYEVDETEKVIDENDQVIEIVEEEDPDKIIPDSAGRYRAAMSTYRPACLFLSGGKVRPATT
ncbi:helix-turn-helix transcriptional regulator [Sphingomonas paucimobilis]|uniref:helix-turn-helix domain-containing protein n=1 Tax=Sphingomonas paucimobilis TaxID=13689 RepID=UPI0028D00080|nr:helix-turn-helix transcriptional regulator [Sphingomonas paucimobilis]